MSLLGGSKASERLSRIQAYEFAQRSSTPDVSRPRKPLSRSAKVGSWAHQRQQTPTRNCEKLRANGQARLQRARRRGRGLGAEASVAQWPASRDTAAAPLGRNLAETLDPKLGKEFAKSSLEPSLPWNPRCVRWKASKTPSEEDRCSPRRLMLNTGAGMSLPELPKGLYFFTAERLNSPLGGVFEHWNFRGEVVHTCKCNRREIQ